MRNYLITSVVDSISANTNLFSLYLTIVGHCCLHQVISRQVCWQSQIIEWDNPGQPCYCAERQIHISLKFKWLFLWYSREWIGVPKSFKSKDGKSYPNRSKTHRNMNFTVASYSLRFFLFSWPVLGDETLNSYLPTTIKMRGTSFNLHILHGKLKSILEPIGPPSPRCLSRFPKSITTPSCMGCQSIARLPLSISSVFPENSLEAIYTPGWRERRCERKVSCPRTQNIDPAKSRTQTSWPKVLCTDRLATVSSV